MALVNGGIAAEAIEIATAIHIPYINAGPAGEDYGKGVVVMGAIFFLELQVLKRKIGGGCHGMGGYVRNLHIKQK